MEAGTCAICDRKPQRSKTPASTKAESSRLEYLHAVADATRGGLARAGLGEPRVHGAGSYISVKGRRVCGIGASRKNGDLHLDIKNDDVALWVRAVHRPDLSPRTSSSGPSNSSPTTSPKSCLLTPPSTP